MLALLDRTALRVVLAAGFAAGAVFAVASCGSASDSAFASGGTFDGGGGHDGGTTIDGGGFDAGASPPSALLVHASPDLEDFRICFGIASSPTGADAKLSFEQPFPDDAFGPMPESNYPGVPVGGGVPLRSFPKGDGFLVPYVIRAKLLGNNPMQRSASCAELLCPSCALSADFDYWKLPAIASSTFAAGSRYLLALKGCRNGDTAAACTNAGPLRMDVAQLAVAPGASAGSIAAQFLHASTNVGPVVLSVRDAGPFTLPGPGSLAPSAGVIAVPGPAKGDLAGYAGETLHLAYGDAGAEFSLALVQRLSDPSMLPTAFFERDSAFVFVILGDPSAAPPVVDGGINSSYDGRGLHVIALPTAPQDSGAD